MPARRGLQWLREGLESVAAAPASWVGITLLFFLSAVVLGLVPFAGVLFSVAVPILVGGVMIGCEARRQGHALEIRHLFSGFEAPVVQPLATLGVFSLAASIAIVVPAMAMAAMGVLSAAAVTAISPRAGLGVLVVVGLLFTFVAVASAALSMALWFSPALVALRHDPPLEAARRSVHAVWRNVGAFLAYGIALVGLASCAMLPLLTAVVLVAAAGQRGMDATPLAAVLLGGTGLVAVGSMLVLMPTTWAAMYASYRDVFADDSA